MILAKDKIFLVVGLGSMGRRRIRNLLYHGISRSAIMGFDVEAKRRQSAEKEYGILTVNTFKKAMIGEKPDAIIISTPPDKHSEYFLYAKKNRINFFVEITTTDKGYDKLMPFLDKTFVSAPSCTFRYFPAVIKLKSLIKKRIIGQPLAFEHYLGQYLPDWHPYENYSNVYFAQKETGGCREMFSHELQWITDVLGSSVAGVRGLRAKISNLNIKADDIYVILVKMKNGVTGSITIDLLNRVPERTFTVIGSKGTLAWDWIGRTITMTTSLKKKTIKLTPGKRLAHYNTGEEPYEAEIKDFLLAVDGKKRYPYTFSEDKKILDTLDQFLKKS